MLLPTHVANRVAGRVGLTVVINEATASNIRAVIFTSGTTVPRVAFAKTGILKLGMPSANAVA